MPVRVKQCDQLKITKYSLWESPGSGNKVLLVNRWVDIDDMSVSRITMVVIETKEEFTIKPETMINMIDDGRLKFIS